MIELLGIGVRKGDGWRVRRVCARFESRTFAAVVSPARDVRVTVLDVIAAREIPSEGRAWIDGAPLSAATAPRLRRRVGTVDLATSPVPERTAMWNVFGLDQPSGLGQWLGLPWRAQSEGPMAALARVGLGSDALTLAGDLDGWSTTRLMVARALRRRPGYLVVAEPDAHLPPTDVGRLLDLLRDLVRRDGLSVFASFADASLAREAAILHVAEGEAVLA